MIWSLQTPSNFYKAFSRCYDLQKYDLVVTRNKCQLLSHWQCNICSSAIHGRFVQYLFLSWSVLGDPHPIAFFAQRKASIFQTNLQVFPFSKISVHCDKHLMQKKLWNPLGTLKLLNPQTLSLLRTASSILGSVFWKHF